MQQKLIPIHYPSVPFKGHYGSIAVDCPASFCKAKAGQYCNRPSGHSGPMISTHAARVTLASNVCLEGLNCSSCGTKDSPENFVSPITGTNTSIDYEPWCQQCVKSKHPTAEPHDKKVVKPVNA